MDEVLRRPESLLHSSPVFRALDEAARRKLATDTITVTTFLSPQPSPPRARKSRSGQLAARRPLTRPELLPELVSGLVTGTFQAIVDASAQQMDAYAALIAEAARSVEQFLPDPEQQLAVAMRLEAALREIFPERDPTAESA